MSEPTTPTGDNPAFNPTTPVKEFFKNPPAWTSLRTLAYIPVPEGERGLGQMYALPDTKTGRFVPPSGAVIIGEPYSNDKFATITLGDEFIPAEVSFAILDRFEPTPGGKRPKVNGRIKQRAYVIIRDFEPAGMRAYRLDFPEGVQNAGTAFRDTPDGGLELFGFGFDLEDGDIDVPAVQVSLLTGKTVEEENEEASSEILTDQEEYPIVRAAAGGCGLLTRPSTNTSDVITSATETDALSPDTALDRAGDTLKTGEPTIVHRETGLDNDPLGAKPGDTNIQASAGTETEL